MIKIFLGDISQLNDVSLCEKLYKNTSPYRKEKIDSFKFENDKRLALKASQLLDEGLKAYGLREKDVNYAIGEKGKPAIEGRPDIHFNVSHSKGKVMVCFASSEVGCDIEKISTPDLALAKRFFHNNESEVVKTAPDTFYRFWTLKESFVKQNGKGLSMPLKDFEVNLDECLVLGSDNFLAEIDAFDGYCAAICTEEREEIEIVYI